MKAASEEYLDSEIAYQIFAYWQCSDAYTFVFFLGVESLIQRSILDDLEHVDRIAS